MYVLHTFSSSSSLPRKLLIWTSFWLTIFCRLSLSIFIECIDPLGAPSCFTTCITAITMNTCVHCKYNSIHCPISLETYSTWNWNTYKLYLISTFLSVCNMHRVIYTLDSVWTFWTSASLLVSADCKSSHFCFSTYVDADTIIHDCTVAWKCFKRYHHH